MTDLSHYTYGDLVAALRKDLQLDASTDLLPHSIVSTNLAQDRLIVPTVSQPARVIGTVYQPNATRPVLVVASINVTIGVAGQQNGLSLSIDNSGAPSTERSRFFAQSSGTGQFQGEVSGLVPAGWSYKLSSFGLTAILSLIQLTEYQL